jgi:hypothetical protein
LISDILPKGDTNKKERTKNFPSNWFLDASHYSFKHISAGTEFFNPSFLSKKYILSSRTTMFLTHLFLWVGLSALLVQAAPMPQAAGSSAGSSYWLSSIKRQGTVAFGSSSDYQIFRNVMDFGAKGRPKSILT